MTTLGTFRPAWFEENFGFKEKDTFDETRQRFTYDPETNILTSMANEKSFYVGKFELLNPADIRQRLADSPPQFKGNITLNTIEADVGNLHRDHKNKNAVFQAASQFNVLEMASQYITPDNGVTGYFYDKTQGPACALACPAGLIFRHFFINGTGQGGPEENQVNLLSKVQDLFPGFWKLQNGYAFPENQVKIKEFNAKIKGSENKINDAIQVGVHWDVEVETFDNDAKYTVCQIYVSACPVGYGKNILPKDWEPLSKIALNSLYETTLGAAALLARHRKERVKVFLTLAGGGVFGNNLEWIKSAIIRAINLYKDEPLDATIVTFRDATAQQFAKKVVDKLEYRSTSKF